MRWTTYSQYFPSERVTCPIDAESILRERLLLSHPGGIASAFDTARAAASPQDQSRRQPRRRQAFPRERQHAQGQGSKTLEISDGIDNSAVSQRGGCWHWISFVCNFPFYMRYGMLHLSFNPFWRYLWHLVPSRGGEYWWYSVIDTWQVFRAQSNMRSSHDDLFWNIEDFLCVVWSLNCWGGILCRWHNSRKMCFVLEFMGRNIYVGVFV